MFNNINKKEKILLIAVLAVCVAFLYIRLYLPSEVDKINTLRSSISDYESKLSSMDVTSKVNMSLRKQLDDLDTKYRQSIDAFPKDGRVPEITYNYQDKAKGNNITLCNLTFGNPQEFTQNKGNTTTSSNGNSNTGSNNTGSGNGNKDMNTSFKLFIIPTTVTVTGAYMNVNEFIASVENATRLTKIENVSLTSSGSGKVTANIAANYYYVPGLVINLEYDFNKGSEKGKADMFKE